MKKFSKIENINEEYGYISKNNPYGLNSADMIDFFKNIPIEYRNRKMLINGEEIRSISFSEDDDGNIQIEYKKKDS